MKNFMQFFIRQSNDTNQNIRYSGSSNGIDWDIDNDWVLIIKSSSSGELTSLDWGLYRDYITAVIFESDNGITSIADDTFFGCDSISNIYTMEGQSKVKRLPNSITEIGTRAFCNCSDLQELKLPSGLTKIGDNAFDSCSFIQKIEIPASVETIGTGIFNNCTALETITVDDGNTKFQSKGNAILERASHILVAGCNKSTIDSSVIKIGDYAFSGCREIKTITIPDSVKEIGKYAFYQCDSIEELTLPSELKTIGEGAFCHCKSLITLTIPTSVTTWNTENAFRNCDSLKSVDFQNNAKITKFGMSMFEECRSLEKITVPASVTEMKKQAFFNCFGLKSVDCASLKDWLGIDFEDHYSNPVYYAKKLTQNGQNLLNENNELVIPDGIKVINNYAFENCIFEKNSTSSNEIKLKPEVETSLGSLTSIGKFAFAGSCGIKEAKFDYLGFKIGIISDYAFSSCTNLTAFLLSECDKILDYAFSGCKSLETIGYYEEEEFEKYLLPEDLDTIGSFAFENCVSLTEINFPHWASVDTIGESIFSGCSSLEKLDTYRAGSQINGVWQPIGAMFGTIPFENSTRTKQAKINVDIGTASSAGSLRFTVDKVIPESHIVEVKYEYDGQKYNAKTFKVEPQIYPGTTRILITLQQGHTNPSTIDVHQALEHCYYYIPNSLKNITIRDGKLLFGDFQNCNNIKQVDIKYMSGKTIPNYCFDGCSSIHNIQQFPTNIETVGAGAFRNCKSLSNFTVGYETQQLFDTLKNIGEEAFWGCSAVSELVIKPVTETIGEGAFGGNPNLTMITIPFVGDKKVTGVSSSYIPFGYMFGQKEYDGAIATIQKTDRAQHDITYYLPQVLKRVRVDNYDTETRTVSNQALSDCAFQNCNKIVSVSLGNSGITRISSYAFQNCTSLFDFTYYVTREIAGETWSSSTPAQRNYKIAGRTLALDKSDINEIKATYQGTEFVITNYSLSHQSSDTIITVVYGDQTKAQAIDNIVVNAQFDYNEIEKISSCAFENCQQLWKFYVPNKVTSLGTNTFKNCYSLGAVLFKKQGFQGSLTSIGKSAFENCYSLTSIDFPGSLHWIIDKAFCNCNSLRRVYSIPNNLYGLGKEAFSGCISLVSIDLRPITSEYFITISEKAFYNCKCLQSITGGVIERTTFNNLTAIGAKAFYGCENLLSIPVPSAVTTIGAKAFYGCTKLQDVFNINFAKWCNITFEKDTEEPEEDYEPITSNPLVYAKKLSDYSGGIHYIDEPIIDATETATTPISSVSAYAFNGFSGFKNITIKGSPTINKNAFCGTTLSEKKVITSSIADWCGITFTNGYSNPLTTTIRETDLYIEGQSAAVQEATIPASVTEIKQNAFLHSTIKKFISTNSSLTKIGQDAFCVCKNLRSVEGFNNVSELASGAFSGDNLLNGITLSSSLQTIPEKAFAYCQAFNNDNFTIPSGVRTIGNGAFYDCIGLGNITLPSSLTTIGNEAFYNCKHIAKLTVPSSVTSIGDNAFDRCIGLNDLVIDDISKWCNINFANYKSNPLFYASELYLKIGDIEQIQIQVNIPSGVEEIKKNVFYRGANRGRSIETIQIPHSMKYIRENAFYNCDSIQEVRYIGNRQAWEQIEIESGNEHLTSAHREYIT